LDSETGLAYFTLYSGITDRAGLAVPVKFFWRNIVLNFEDVVDLSVAGVRPECVFEKAT
jgi:hypothetical protein